MYPGLEQILKNRENEKNQIVIFDKLMQRRTLSCNSSRWIMTRFALNMMRNHFGSILKPNHFASMFFASVLRTNGEVHYPAPQLHPPPQHHPQPYVRGLNGGPRFEFPDFKFVEFNKNKKSISLGTPLRATSASYRPRSARAAVWRP